MIGRMQYEGRYCMDTVVLLRSEAGSMCTEQLTKRGTGNSCGYEVRSAVMYSRVLWKSVESTERKL